MFEKVNTITLPTIGPHTTYMVKIEIANRIACQIGKFCPRVSSTTNYCLITLIKVAPRLQEFYPNSTHAWLRLLLCSGGYSRASLNSFTFNTPLLRLKVGSYVVLRPTCRLGLCTLRVLDDHTSASFGPSIPFSITR